MWKNAATYKIFLQTLKGFSIRFFCFPYQKLKFKGYIYTYAYSWYPNYASSNQEMLFVIRKISTVDKYMPQRTSELQIKGCHYLFVQNDVLNHLHSLSLFQYELGYVNSGVSLINQNCAQKMLFYSVNSTSEKNLNFCPTLTWFPLCRMPVREKYWFKSCQIDLLGV